MNTATESTDAPSQYMLLFRGPDWMVDECSIARRLREEAERAAA